MKYIKLFVNLILLFAVHPACANTAQQLLLLEGASAPHTWAGPDVPDASPTTNLQHDKTGLSLSLPMRRLLDRAYWDATVRLDLTPWRVLSFEAQIDDPSAVKRAAIYFRSGDGWYGGWFELQGNHWQTISISRSDFQIEGNPAGWNQIRAVRIAFWKENDCNTTARIAHLRAHNTPILILRNTDARLTKPQDADFGDRLTDRLLMWFRQYDIPATIITDDDLRQAPPPQGTRIVILPFNPVLTNQVPQQLKTFTDNGGKLIVAYALDDFIAPLLGLERWEWMRAEPSDAFAFMKFQTPDAHALPERVPQDSWNINRPIPAQANVIATWQNSHDIDSNIPAVTISRNGVFIGHVLTNTGRTEKMRMLMAFIAKLAPDLAPLMADVATTRATSLRDDPDWNKTRAFILDTARAHSRQPHIQPIIETLDQDIKRLQHRLPKLSYPQAATHAANLRHRIQSAYYQSLSPRNAARNEFRGVWAHDAAGIRGMPWNASVAALAAAGMNNLFANVVWAGAAFYPSDVLPNVAGNKDFAREVTDAAQQHGMRIHAWMVLWSLQHAPDDFIRDMRRLNRLQADRNGKERPWLCPSHPDNRDLAAKAAVEIIQRYPFDGFHADYIRHHDANTCYCQGCRQRFAAANKITISRWPQDVTTGQHHDAWKAWRRETIDSMMARLHQDVKHTNPQVQVSAAVWPGWPAVRESIAQDWPSWAENGWVDFFTPMNYVNANEEAIRLYRTQRAAVAAHIPIYPGLAPSTLNLSPAATLQQIDALRNAGAPGFMLFDLDRDLLQQHMPALGAGATRQ